MAENLVINGVTYPAVETISAPNESGEVIEYHNLTDFIPNAKRWDYTLIENVTGIRTITLVAEEPWIAENINNERLCVLVIPKSTKSGATRVVGGSFGANYALQSLPNGISYGVVIESSASGQNPRASIMSNPLNQQRNGTGGVSVDSDGNILYYILEGNITMVAGDYLVIAWLV